MALDPLATTADLLQRPGISGGAALDNALDIASTLIRDAAGSAISETTATVVVIGTRANMLELPGPVTEVTSVTIDATTVAASDYVALPNGLWRHCGWSCGYTPQRVTVDYTFGLSVVPADIVDFTCTLAKAWLDHQAEGGGSTAGLSSVRLDDAAEAYTAEAAGQLSPVFIPDATRQWLGRRFGSSVAVVEML